jgi:hypothetical protein
MLRAGITALGLTLLVSSAFGNVPDTGRSTVPRCLNVCPAGDLGFTVTVRDANDTPLGGVTVELYPGGCPAEVALLCADCSELSGYDSVRKSFVRVTNAGGQASFHLCGTVECPAGGTNWVEVAADGVVIGFATFLATDVDHDLDVDAADVAGITAALGGVNHPADQDCDHVITAADVAAVNAHVGHQCSGPVPVLPRSWGLLKAAYR